MTDRSAYLDGMRAKLAQLDSELDRLRERERASDDVQRADFERRIEIVALQRRALEEQLRDLEQRPESGWEDFKDGIERAWGELGQALDDTVTRYGR